MKIKLSVGTILVLLVVVFTLQNTEVVNIQFLFWSFSLSRALMIFVVFGAGVLIGAFLSNLPRMMEKKQQHGREITHNDTEAQ